jgi:hypothetical protein
LRCTSAPEIADSDGAGRVGVRITDVEIRSAATSISANVTGSGMRPRYDVAASIPGRL